MELFSEGIGALLQPVLEVLITVLAPAVLGLLAAWLNSLREKINTEIEERGLQQLREYAIALVKAAEQAGIIGELEDVGEAKKQMVLELLQAEADRLGIQIDVQALSAIIEAAVVDVFGFSESEETFG